MHPIRVMPPTGEWFYLHGVFLLVWQEINNLVGWQEASIYPVPNPGKDGFNPINCRSMSLMSCLCNTIERVINWHLVWFQEWHDFIPNVQC